ncbi:Paf1 [Dictyocaulus viviparus]|uniref:RNA polymerase II-associated factor 1 homolog n=1 Tax=Dictyocaulus viviparus TaxID=29172 RepID=A0A0D8XT73_DICVI|nr:Paf1 [Dictyocaulus viviparus]
MTQPTQKPGSGKHKSRGSDFICKPRFRNTLPDVPFPGKFLPCPFVELERFIDYKPTSLEMEYKFEVQCEMDMGLNLDLIDPNTYKVDPNIEIQPTQKPGSGKHKSRGSDFICKPRFRNTLPDVPFPGKFLPCPFVELERFIDYKPTSLEMEYKFEVQCEMDMGLNLDLIDPNTYKVDPNIEIQLNEKDAILLEDEDSNAKQIKRSAQHSKVVPWMRKTQYISSEFNRFGVAADRQEIKVGYNLTKNKENLSIFRDRQSQINLIKKSFEDSKVPLRKHFSKKGVTAVEEIPILPDFELWKFPFALVQFDADPSPVGFAPELRASMITQSHIKGMQDDDGDQFVAYFIPTVETLQKNLNDKEEGRMKNKNTKGFERDNFFVYYKDGCFHYNELETKVRLARRRRPIHEKPNTRLHITYTKPSEAELQQMSNRLNALLKDYDSDDEAEKPSEKSDSDGEESAKKPTSRGSDDSNNESVQERSSDNSKDDESANDDSDGSNKKTGGEKESSDESD